MFLILEACIMETKNWFKVPQRSEVKVVTKRSNHSANPKLIIKFPIQSLFFFAVICFTLLMAPMAHAETTSINLAAGWNFVSFPKLPLDVTVESVFSDVSANIRVIWGYDNATKEWKKYKRDKLENTLSIIESGKGYWVYMNAPGTVNMTQWSSPTSTTIHLYNGWNLIGYNGTDGTPIDTALSSLSNWDIIWAWDNGQWSAKYSDLSKTLSVSPLTTLNQGKAYWIKMTGAADWDSVYSAPVKTLVSIKIKTVSIPVDDTENHYSIPVDASQQFTVTATYSDGTTADITSLVTWSSDVTSVATINTGGLARGVAVGNAVITAKFGTWVGTTNLTVTVWQNHIVSDGVRVQRTSFGSGATANLATFNLNTAGNGILMATATISPLTFGPGPEEYWGKNRSLRVDVLWKVLVDGVVIGAFQQTAEQNIIQFQAAVPTTAGLKAITLQAVNNSYWNLDEAPYGTTPEGSQNFDVVFSAMELDGS